MKYFLVLKILSLIGLCISLYSMRVKRKIKQSRDYRPMCDIGENISCTKALGSRYSTTVGVPNPALGMLYYSLIIGLSFWAPQHLLFPATAAVLFSLYLAFISYVVQRNFCLVCTATYAVNIGILITVILS